jgi:hypothetical protein
MATIVTKHFQYTGTDDYDTSLDEQINEFLKKEGIDDKRLVSIQYNGHSATGVNTYSALVVYKKD